MVYGGTDTEPPEHTVLKQAPSQKDLSGVQIFHVVRTQSLSTPILT